MGAYREIFNIVAKRIDAKIIYEPQKDYWGVELDGKVKSFKGIDLNLNSLEEKVEYDISNKLNCCKRFKEIDVPFIKCFELGNDEIKAMQKAFSLFEPPFETQSPSKSSIWWE